MQRQVLNLKIPLNFGGKTSWKVIEKTEKKMEAQNWEKSWGNLL
jgi:hypothetical protein